MNNNNNPTDEIVPTQAVTEQVEQIDPTAATVYKDVYETQVATVYQNVNSAQSGGEQEEQASQGVPDEFRFAGNRYEPSKKTLTSKTYHSDTIGGTLTFPDSWINNVKIEDDGYRVRVFDSGGSAGDNSIMDIDSGSNLSKEELHEILEQPNGDIILFNIYNFYFGYSQLPGEDTYILYKSSLSWNKSLLYRTNLDYSKINSEILSVLESFHPDNSNFTSLLTQKQKDNVMKFTGSDYVQQGC